MSKDGLIKGAALVCALLFWPQTAMADPWHWTDPSGRMTITLPQSWVAVDPRSVTSGDGDIFAAKPSDPDELAACRVHLVEQHNEGASSREQLNLATQHMLELPGVNVYRNNPGISLDRTESTEINGIAVLNIWTSMTHVRAIDRRFFFFGAGVLQLYTLSCTAFYTDATANAEIQSVTTSLQLNETSAPK